MDEVAESGGNRSAQLIIVKVSKCAITHIASGSRKTYTEVKFTRLPNSGGISPVSLLLARSTVAILPGKGGRGPVS